jgi:hypothetical protein
MPSARRAAATCSPANGSSRGSSDGPCSSTVTSSLPSAFQACAISMPTTPPPSTTRRRGAAFAVVASRLVHGSDSRSPGTGGTDAEVPVASTTARVACSSTSPSAVVTETVRSPVSRPRPLTRATPAVSSQRTWPASSWCEV